MEAGDLMKPVASARENINSHILIPRNSYLLPIIKTDLVHSGSGELLWWLSPGNHRFTVFVKCDDMKRTAVEIALEHGFYRHIHRIKNRRVGMETPRNAKHMDRHPVIGHDNRGFCLIDPQHKAAHTPSASFMRSPKGLPAADLAAVFGRVILRM